MNNKTRKIVATLSIIFIIGLYAYKGLPSFTGMTIGDALPIIVTSLAVTGVKVGIIYGTIIIGKKIVKKIKNTNDMKKKMKLIWELKK